MRGKALGKSKLRRAGRSQRTKLTYLGRAWGSAFLSTAPLNTQTS